MLNSGFSKSTFQSEGEIIQNNGIFGHFISPVTTFSWVFRIIVIEGCHTVVCDPSNHETSISSSIILMHRPMRKIFVSPRRSNTMTRFKPTDVTFRYYSACSPWHFLIQSSVRLCVRWCWPWNIFVGSYHIDGTFFLYSQGSTFLHSQVMECILYSRLRSTFLYFQD